MHRSNGKKRNRIRKVVEGLFAFKDRKENIQAKSGTIQKINYIFG